MVGQTISHYKIIDKLGAGGMGVVYKALDLKLERTVALKFLHTDTAVSDRDKERLLREARAASALDHPNIGVIYGLEESDDRQLYIVMGYYEGETLARRLARGRISVHESLDLAVQIARGLSAAHARNIIHRDIKPSNIILTADNVAKIVDFGLARVIASPSMTQSGEISGTVTYMSPEQTLGKPVDQRTDVWALGIVMAEMLAGQNPFARDTPSSVIFAILNQPPVLAGAIPAEVQSIIYRALSKDPDTRYPSCKELLSDLQALPSFAGLAVDGAAPTVSTLTKDLEKYVKQASTPSWGTDASRKPVKRWRLAVGAVFVLLVGSLFLNSSIRDRITGALLSSNERHIAVLPFDNIGNNPANEILAQGLMDSLTSRLSNLEVGKQSLWVVPASVVRGRKVDDPSAALRELDATLVVKGSIERDGQNVRLTVNLINTKTLRQIGSAELEDRAGDFASLQDEAVSKLAHLMGITVTPEMLKATGGNVNPAAYESYLKALGYLQRYDKPGNLDLAIAALNDAVKADPQFAVAYAELADAYRMRYGLDPSPKWVEEAVANASRAAEIDSHIPAVYVTLARTHALQSKYDLALQEFQQALQLDPHSADALEGLAGTYERMGRFAEAESTFKKSVNLRPDFWGGYNSLGRFYTRRGKYADAIAQFQRVIELTPDNSPAYLNLAAVYLDMGDPKEISSAEQALKKSIELSPSYPAYANLGLLYYNEKRFEDSAAATEKALTFNDKDFHVWSNLLATYEWLKKDDKAAVALEREQKLVEDAVKDQPQDATAQSELAGLYAKQKMREKALIRIQTALAISPDDPRVLMNVADAYEVLGDRQSALRNVEKALQKGYPLEDLKSDPDQQALLQDPKFRPSGK
ncbi:MAG TPA: protein kinase [Candidatus Acidoferrales bacterium]|nr:protein kinase [Candidatus Acidoferrales bacterium]